jgi:hypothetical protein
VPPQPSAHGGSRWGRPSQLIPGVMQIRLREGLSLEAGEHLRIDRGPSESLAPRGCPPQGGASSSSRPNAISSVAALLEQLPPAMPAQQHPRMLTHLPTKGSTTAETTGPTSHTSLELASSPQGGERRRRGPASHQGGGQSNQHCRRVARSMGLSVIPSLSPNYPTSPVPTSLKLLLRCRCSRQNHRLHNKGLERTRRVGVPASRAVVRVSPCRSTQCSTDPGKPYC